MNNIQSFLDEMSAMGVEPENPENIIADDVRRRFKVVGDKPKTENGAYSLCEEGDFMYGWFMTHKDQVVHKWHTKSNTRMSDEERANHKKFMDEKKAARLKKEKEDRIECYKKSNHIWNEASVSGSNDYLVKKKIGLNGARVYKDAIVVPVRNGADLLGLQFIGNSGEKRFLTNTPIDGGYFSMAKMGDDFSRIYIAEGYATAASVREATGNPVVIAFNAGNMKAVTVKIHKKYPEAHIVIASDNDHETTNAKNEPWNVGMEKAGQAAVAIGGAHVVGPETEAGIFDWSDVHLKYGLEAVLTGLTVERAPPIQKEPENSYMGTEGDLEDYDPPMVDEDDDGTQEPSRLRTALDEIRPLGHNRREYFFFPKASGQVVSLTANSLGRIQTLYELAPRQFWEEHYGGESIKDADITKYASANLIQECQRIGVYSPENTRGVGIWRDGDKTIVNCGNIVTDGVIKVHPSEYEGASVYESGHKIYDMDVTPLSNSESSNLLEVCKMLNWRRPQFADILAGWLVLAPFSGALGWRPHIVVTGQKGSGKSTVMRDIVKEVLGEICLDLDGGTTEAGLRRALGVSGRPVVMDEAESETARDRTEMEKIFTLIRKSSSGGVIVNANARFVCRSCYCLGAINPRIEQGADKDRNTQIELVKNTSRSRDQDYKNLLDKMNETLVEGYGNRLVARTFANFENLRYNIDTFRHEISKVLGDKRAGDQIGPMIAASYSLITKGKIPKEKVASIVHGRDWSFFTNSQDMTDADKLVMHILSFRARYDHMGMSRESSIGELIVRAISEEDDNKSADRGLRGYGIKIIGDRIAISNSSPQLRKILNETPWNPWARTLGDYTDAGTNNNKAVFFQAGVTSKVTTIPLASVLENAGQEEKQPEPQEEEIEIDMDGF